MNQICFDLDGEMGIITPAVILGVQGSSWLLFRWIPEEKQRKIHKLLFVYAATLVLGVGFGVLSGYGWISAFFRANLLAYAQVFGHQVFKNIGR